MINNNNNNKIRLFLLSALSLSRASHALTGDCYPGEKEVEFTLFLDEDSTTEQGWTMQCDDQLIWNKHVGHLITFEDDLDQSAPFVVDQACVPEAATCHFTIIDSYGDGIYTPGFFTLTYEATTVAVYDEEHAFEEISYCFGPGCPTNVPPPREIDDDCDNMYMYIQLDGSMDEEMAYNVKCNDEIIWHGLFNHTNLPLTGMEQQTCVPINSCCIFTASDSGMKEYGGSVYLEWSSKTIIDYRGGETGHQEYVEFGSGCPERTTPDDKPVESAPVTPKTPTFETPVGGVAASSSITQAEGTGLSTGITVAIAIIAAIVALIVVAVVYRFSTKGSAGRAVVVDDIEDIKPAGSNTSDEASEDLSHGNGMR